MSYKPDGYTSLAPYLVVDEATEVVEFLEETFGAEQLRSQRREDGSVKHAEVRIDDTVVMIGGVEEPAMTRESMLFVYVDDVDAVFERGLEAGGNGIQEPERPEGQPDRRGALEDPAGNTWWIGTLVE